MKTTYVLEPCVATKVSALRTPQRAPSAHPQLATALAVLVAAMALMALAHTGSSPTVPPGTGYAMAEALPVVAAPQPTAAATPGDASASPQAEAAAPSPWVQRISSGVRIDARAAPRRALVEQLAAATGTQLFGSTAALQATPVVSLRWQGRDALPLWAELLEGRVNFAAQCDVQGCKVWLLGATPVTPAPAQGAPSVPQAHWPSPPQPDPPGLFPAD
jgi:hypothetical protein